MNFQSFNLSALILKNLELAGYTQPTPIQEKSLPIILEGNDLIGLAQTGTGKTAAFVLPILHRLLNQPGKGIRALIVVPTRELAEQIHGEFGKLGKDSKLRGALLYGGVDIRKQINQLRRGVDIVIACPGRLLDHVNRGTVNLTKVEIVVLDEADHMFDMGFIDDIRTMLGKLSQKKQSLLFSATMPKAVLQLIKDYLVDPITVQVNPTIPARTVTQSAYPVPEKLKTDLLLKLLDVTPIQSALIFTRTKRRAEQLADQLVLKGFNSSSFQSNLTQYKRKNILKKFREGSINILVATDIVARGIDISRVSHVINFDLPNTVEAYTHRIGRTGRASQSGTAFTFITRSENARFSAIERKNHEKIQRDYLSDFDYKNHNPSVLLQDSVEEKYDSFQKKSSSQKKIYKKRNSGIFHLTNKKSKNRRITYANT